MRSIVNQVPAPVTSYGMEEGRRGARHQRARRGAQMHFTVQRRNGVVLPDLDVVLNLAGRHNVLNALSAIAVRWNWEHLDDAACVRAPWPRIQGVGRRFQRYGDRRCRRRHRDGAGRLRPPPVEMAATLAAARGAISRRRLVLAFQPHRYSPARATASEDSVRSWARPMPCCSVKSMPQARPHRRGRWPVPGAHCAWRARSNLCSWTTSAPWRRLLDNARDGDVVLCMGAGSIGQVSAKVVDGYKTE